MEGKLDTEERLDEWCEVMVEQLRLRAVGPAGVADIGRDWCGTGRRSGLRATVEPSDDLRPASKKPCLVKSIKSVFISGHRQSNDKRQTDDITLKESS